MTTASPDVMRFVFVRMAAAMRPPAAPLGLVERAGRMRISEGLPDDAADYDIHDHPAQLECLRAIGSMAWQKYVIVKPVQDGGTLSTITAPLLWLLVDRQEAVFCMFPDMILLAKYWRGKFRPTLCATGYADRLPRTGPGSDDGVPDDLQLLPGGHVYFAGAGSANESAQASVTTRWVLIDEYAKVRRRQAEAAKKRTESFDGDYHHVYVSTIGHDVNDPLLEQYDLSTMGRLMVALPCCGAYQRMEWEQVQTESATYRCVSCGAAVTDDDRRQAIRRTALVVHAGQRVEDGRVVGAMPTGRIWGLRWSSLDSPRRGLQHLIDEHAEALARIERFGDHEGMRQFFRDQLARQYVVAGATINVTRQHLAARSAQGEHERGQVPEWAEEIIVTIDEQLRRCYWFAWAGAADGRRALIDWGEEWWATGGQEPTDEQRHAVLDRIRLRATADGWPLRGSDQIMRAELVAVDIGYNEGGSVGRYVSAHRSVLAVRGRGLRNRRQAADEVTRGSVRVRQYLNGLVDVRRMESPPPRQPGVWWFVLTPGMWDIARNRWLRELGAAGCWYLPRGLTDESPIIRHLASRQISERDDGTIEWVKNGREDWNDCLCYAEALMCARAERAEIMARRPARQPGVVARIG